MEYHSRGAYKRSMEDKIHHYLGTLFEFEKDVTTFTVTEETNFDNKTKDDTPLLKKIHDSTMYHIHIRSKRIGRMIGSKGWVLKLLYEVIELKFGVKSNFHLETPYNKTGVIP